MSRSPTRRSAPSPVFRATLPVNPSVTITSVVPAAMSSPSTNPWNCGAMWLLFKVSAAWRTRSSPFNCSVPTFSRPMVGAGRPRTVRANTSPMMANSTRLRASHCTLAPRSSMTTSPRAEGAMAAIAGRSMPGSVLMTIFASASSAPVLPADTTPEASPWATASMARRIEEPRTRNAAVGFISLSTTAGAWRMVQDACTRFRRAISGARRASSPTSRNRAAGCRSAAMARPSSTTSGAPSPPIASTARVNGALMPPRSYPVAVRAPRPRSDADSALQRLARSDDLTAIVVAAMAA